MDKSTWKKIENHVRSYLFSKYDPARRFEKDAALVDFTVDHKGFYIGSVDSSGEDLGCSGFMVSESKDLIHSSETATSELFAQYQRKHISLEKLKTSTFHFSMILDCVYMPDPMSWDENKDGIYFQWGQDYRALYLPYQIARKNVSKAEIMNQLCSWEAGLASNLWRTPEGLCYKIVCESHSS